MLERKVEVLKPVLDRVIIEVKDPEDTTTEAGIIIPAAAHKEREMKRGVVIALGPGRRLEDGTFISSQVRVGDKVFFWQGNNYSRIRNGVKRYYVVKEDAIFAIIEENSTL
jgi:chaperonin GroES